jgi:hypothetical protein
MDPGVYDITGFIPKLRAESYIWSFALCGGTFTGCGGAVNTTDFVNHSLKSVFMCIDGSYLWDWDSQDNVQRAALASKGWTVNCLEADEPYFPFNYMGMGETIGYSVRASTNNSETYHSQFFKRYVSNDLLGDPTIRMHIVCPVNSLQSAITANNTILLAWKPADDSIIGYNVYKLDTLENKYKKITLSPVTDNWFEDTVPVAGNNYYMVRTFKLSQVACGSYYNLSQGTFDTINYTEQASVPVSGIDLTLNPGNILPLKIWDPFIIDAAISPANATNKLLKWSVENRPVNEN